MISDANQLCMQLYVYCGIDNNIYSELTTVTFGLLLTIFSPGQGLLFSRQVTWIHALFISLDLELHIWLKTEKS
jgi:hypothetical protein